MFPSSLLAPARTIVTALTLTGTALGGSPALESSCNGVPSSTVGVISTESDVEDYENLIPMAVDSAGITAASGASGVDNHKVIEGTSLSRETDEAGGERVAPVRWLATNADEARNEQRNMTTLSTVNGRAYVFSNSPIDLTILIMESNTALYFAPHAESERNTGTYYYSSSEAELLVSAGEFNQLRQIFPLHSTMGVSLGFEGFEQNNVTGFYCPALVIQFYPSASSSALERPDQGP